MDLPLVEAATSSDVLVGLNQTVADNEHSAYTTRGTPCVVGRRGAVAEKDNQQLDVVVVAVVVVVEVVGVVVVVIEGEVRVVE